MIFWNCSFVNVNFKLKTMTKLFNFFAILVFSFVAFSCDDDDDQTMTSDLVLNITGLEDLGTDYVYEGWMITGGNAVSTGVFTVDDQGKLSKTAFSVDEMALKEATTFVLTIEPARGDDPAPSSVHILAGDFVNNSGTLSISHPAALGNDFSNSSGKFILATPTDGSDADELSGIWFLDLASGAPATGLNLPELPAGWKYEGWAVIDGTPVTSGTFLMTDVRDDFDGFSSDVTNGPPFPGEDYLFDAPDGLSFPVDLSGGAGVISIEPDPDNSPAPFLLKPLVGPIPDPAIDHQTYEMNQNLSFPEGTVSR